MLVADGDRNTRRRLRSLLSLAGYEVEAVGSLKEALERLEGSSYDLIVTELRFESGDGEPGLELIRRARGKLFPPQVIVVSDGDPLREGIKSLKLGAFDFIAKPVDPDELLRRVKAALEREPQPNLTAFEDGVEGIVGRTPAMREVFELIARVCRTDCTVLILGESGTGKELVARAIHKNSPRRDKPLITVNCGAIPENLLESELFGHVRGAFTGADRDKAGILQEADGGTVFLDEIGEMPLTTQVKLLRFLQYGEIRRVGENKPIHVDVRLIAATNVDLEKAVARGRFRQDLYYRLNVVTIYLPPLRERKEDIPLLAHHFLRKFSEKTGKRVEGIDPKAMEAMMRYDWPGNVRELENAIERAVVLTRSDTIGLDDLPPGVRGGPSRAAEIDSNGGFWVSDDLTLNELERAYIIHTLRRCETLEEAARRLGISRTTLWRKMKRYRIKLRREVVT